MSQALVETRNLKKYFKTPQGNLHAVDGINMRVQRGRTLGVVGESGCGKSTLGRTILRLVEPTDGEILFAGKHILRLGKEELRKERKRMQMIFQDPYSSINPRMTVGELIADPIEVNGIITSKDGIEARVFELMKTVGLADRLFNTYPHELDGGRRQRIGIARALALNPEFIVCDEPVSALDVSIQAQILNLLMDLQRDLSLTYMFVTHNLSVVKHISNDILVMYLGQCVEQAPTNELFSAPKHPYTQALLSAIPVPDLQFRDKPMEIIRGEVTSPINPKPGCRFASRCKFAKPECSGADIEQREVAPGHFVSCILY